MKFAVSSSLYKETKVMTTVETTQSAINGECVEVVDSFCLLGSIINNKGSSRKMTQIGTLRTRMKDLQM